MRSVTISSAGGRDVSTSAWVTRRSTEDTIHQQFLEHAIMTTVGVESCHVFVMKRIEVEDSSIEAPKQRSALLP